MSLIARIESYAQRHPDTWIHGGHYQRLAMQAGYMPSNADRRLRELSEGENPVLEKRERADRTVEYRYRKITEQPPPPRPMAQQGVLLGRINQ